MDRWKVFDRALFEKQIGGIGIIVILDVVYLITGVFFGRMEFELLCNFILLINMFNTCILYHNFIVSRGDMKFELNTEKIVYYPTTRTQFLLNKYAKTLIFLVIQLILNTASLGLGYFGCHGELDQSRIISSFLMVLISILFTSGVAIIVMHLMPLGIYLSLLLYFPLSFLAGWLEQLPAKSDSILLNEYVAAGYIGLITIIVWMLLLWIGVKIYEKVS